MNKHKKAKRASRAVTAATALMVAGPIWLVSTMPSSAFAATSATASSEVPTARAAKAIAFAKTQLGKPYVFGATGPGSWDCSALVQAAWGAAGVSIGRDTYAQATLTRVSKSSMRPGDLLLYDIPGDSQPNPNHVAMYMGNGQVIEATASLTATQTILSGAKRGVNTSYESQRDAYITSVVRPAPGDVAGGTTPPPVVKLPVVDISMTIAAAKAGNGDVTVVQNGLAKLGFLTTAERGPFGPKTKTAYAAYQRSLGYTGSDADGIPGATSLTKLGSKTGLFTVTP